MFVALGNVLFLLGPLRTLSALQKASNRVFKYYNLNAFSKQSGRQWLRADLIFSPEGIYFDPEGA
jgi:hypothetical protein